MRAGGAPLSAGRRRRSGGALSPILRCPLRGFSRNKDPQVPQLLLQDMDLCYRLLRRMVPGLPPGRAASRVEILQHVIDYILDRGEPLHPDRTQQLKQRPHSGRSPATDTQSGQSPKKHSEDEESRTAPMR